MLRKIFRIESYYGRVNAKSYSTFIYYYYFFFHFFRTFQNNFSIEFLLMIAFVTRRFLCELSEEATRGVL